MAVQEKLSKASRDEGVLRKEMEMAGEIKDFTSEN